MVKIQDFMKPAPITSAGLIIVAASNLFVAPPLLVRIGWLLIAFGSVWFFLRKTK